LAGETSVPLVPLAVPEAADPASRGGGRLISVSASSGSRGVSTSTLSGGRGGTRMMIGSAGGRFGSRGNGPGAVSVTVSMVDVRGAVLRDGRSYPFRRGE
jgi:hypothetical protein